ncbi:hypothetical protein MSAS_15470 [Mycobacterium saskatchewanense]|uniref:Luciferase-like domain-containing protein n=1 Tax=Mycobacterium saskatchewanense TaxID=220927 RepID=A0AAJ3NSI3_9MYCO|nr:hypothetical protein AWC23_07750 [Mycobacterium saskatchewanense]BBX62373.1 hypothetical protein MSAS_15470 [Mycobacterium saskatchewanense]
MKFADAAPYIVVGYEQVALRPDLQRLELMRPQLEGALAPAFPARYVAVGEAIGGPGEHNTGGGNMKLGMPLRYYGSDFGDVVAQLTSCEAIGLDRVMIAEAYSFDAVSQMGYVAAKTHRVELAFGLLPMYSWTPTNLAMTAAGADYVSGARCILGTGASGPQVIEALHGVKYDAPVARAREHVERSVVGSGGGNPASTAVATIRCRWAPIKEAQASANHRRSSGDRSANASPVLLAAIGPRNGGGLPTPWGVVRKQQHIFEGCAAVR